MSISPLPDQMRPGMVVLCVFAFISCLATLGLMGFLLFRFIADRNETRSPLYKNQYMILIFSLVLADFQCDLGFFLDVMWLHRGEIIAPSVGCWIQAWLVNVGDLGSGFFVLAIAAHTFSNVVFGHKIGLRSLLLGSVALWVIALVLTLAPIFMHSSDIFVTQGNWCSINAKYDILRLYFHYIWVFIAEGLVVIMYLTTFIVLRKRMGTILPQLGQRSGTTSGVEGPQNNTKTKKISRATMYMILYPLIYVVTTLPLAAGRISGLAGKSPTKTYLIAGGTLMACGGWMNVLLYSITRRIFISGKPAPVHDGRRSWYGNGKGSVLRTTGDGIELSQNPTSPYREIPSPVESTDYIVSAGRFKEDGKVGRAKDGVIIETTWDVKIEQAKKHEKGAAF
ncbi:hypothetical protein B0J14DRAFT_493619 [Halenospora varia]|nr:hypothetical protein B0J14DRAFT_493619 [Halenospora varia]